jgi:hypothetical protein
MPIENDGSYQMPKGEPHIERGRPNGFLDASDWIWPGSWLSKLLLWNRKVDSHEISLETERTLELYIAVNNLQNVKVRLNQYRPGGEWKRLFKNRSVGAGWRYTLGILSVLGYTIFPGRFFGGDNYNPYTNTVNIYSDIPAIALHEGGHTKDFTQRSYKGSYAALTILPFVPLYSEGLASSDTLSYLRSEKDLEGEKNAYKVLYPAYGTYVVGGAAVLFPPFSTLIAAAAVIPGHIIGRIRAAVLDPEDLEGAEKTAATRPQKTSDGW